MSFITVLPIDLLVPSSFNIRSEQSIDSDAHIDLLAANIAQNGLLHPPTVLKTVNDQYEIVAGFRRVCALRQLGWVDVPCTVLKSDKDAFQLSFSENMQRSSMMKRDICRAIKQYLSENENNVGEVARIMNLSKGTIKKYALISQLPDEVLKRLDSTEDDYLSLKEAEKLALQLTSSNVSGDTTDTTSADAATGATATATPDADVAKKERKRPVKADPWIFDGDNNPLAIPPALYDGVYKFITSHPTD